RACRGATRASTSRSTSTPPPRAACSSPSTTAPRGARGAARWSPGPTTSATRWTPATGWSAPSWTGPGPPARSTRNDAGCLLLVEVQPVRVLHVELGVLLGLLVVDRQ